MKECILYVTLLLIMPTLAQTANLTVPWVDRSDNEVNFKLERSLTGNMDDFAVVASPGANVMIYTDTGLAEKMTYYYRVAACNEVGCSAYAAVARGTTPASIPLAPSALTVTPLP